MINHYKILGLVITYGSMLIYIASFFSGLEIETKVGYYNPMLIDSMLLMLLGVIIIQNSKKVEQ